jgi:hypothetical protein|tara:strand:+ start:3507 stop:4283 length:777 start_codon:yes stop_codon:yes gene_type:complete
MAEEQQAEGLMETAKIEEPIIDGETEVEKNPMAHTEAKTEELTPEEVDDLERPDWMPQKFWDKKDGPDVESLSKSYADLEKKFSQGKHKVPDTYDMSVLDEAGIKDDDPAMKVYMDWAKDAKISQAHFETLAKNIIDLNGPAQDDTISITEEKKKLGSNADEIINSNANWGRKLISDGVFSENDYEQLSVLGGTAEGQMTIRKLRTLAGEKDIPIQSQPTLGDETPEDLHNLVGSERYKNDATFRRSVEKKYEKMFNG